MTKPSSKTVPPLGLIQTAVGPISCGALLMLDWEFLFDVVADGTPRGAQGDTRVQREMFLRKGVVMIDSLPGNSAGDLILNGYFVISENVLGSPNMLVIPGKPLDKKDFSMASVSRLVNLWSGSREGLNLEPSDPRIMWGWNSYNDVPPVNTVIAIQPWAMLEAEVAQALTNYADEVRQYWDQDGECVGTFAIFYRNTPVAWAGGMGARMPRSCRYMAVRLRQTER